MDRIFIQIAAYRDPECQATIRDLFAKAEHPSRLFVGLCWQVDPARDPDLVLEGHSEQVRRIDVHARDSLGVCWARGQTQTLHRGEEYTLLTDSHMRFVPGWDVKLTEELAECPSLKPILSCSPARYEPPDRLEAAPRPTIRTVRPFQPDGVLRCRGLRLTRVPPHPLPAAFLACGFIFARSEIIMGVPYDPHLYFSQEEVSMSVRLWTHGWDFFSSRQTSLYHYYRDATNARPLHWDDHCDFRRRDHVATQRFLCLLGMTPTRNPEVLRGLDVYGLGGSRTLREYEEFSGVLFRERKLTERALRCDFIDNVQEYLRRW
jgi:Glycosyltransferase (GlcNAc)